MDAILTTDARMTLASAAAVSKGAFPAGFLTGHIRGGRFIVEGFVAADAAALADPEIYFRLDALTSGRIIGFLLPASSPASLRPLLRPHAGGKLVLTPKRGQGRRPSWRGFSVEFDGKFFFAPVRIVRFKEKTSTERWP
ncbi:MAG: hypothetical protein PHI34_13005 [Acidobacteriota bacterium]|nr:hypothetical protein [Acidobacteriota bacterium]